jgi:hypothetical protein
MITVLHHIAFSLLLRSFNLSSFADQSWYLLNQTSFAVLSDVINDSYNYGKQVCLFLEGCGLINYIFIVVFLLRLTHSTYLLSSVIEDLLLYLTLLFNFCTHRFCLLSTKNTLISCYLLQIGDKYTRYRV